MGGKIRYQSETFSYPQRAYPRKGVIEPVQELDAPTDNKACHFGSHFRNSLGNQLGQGSSFHGVFTSLTDSFQVLSKPLAVARSSPTWSVG